MEEKNIIDKLIEGYKEDFLSKTGKKLFITMAEPDFLYLDTLLSVVNTFIPAGYTNNMGKPIVSITGPGKTYTDIGDLRKIFCNLAFKRGFKKTQISRFLKIDHTSVIKNIKKLNEAIDVTIGYEFLLNSYAGIKSKMEEHERNLRTVHIE